MAFKVTRLHEGVPVSPKVLLSQFQEMKDIEAVVAVVKRNGIFSTYWSHMKVGDICVAAKILDADAYNQIMYCREVNEEDDADPSEAG